MSISSSHNDINICTSMSSENAKGKMLLRKSSVLPDFVDSTNAIDRRINLTSFTMHKRTFRISSCEVE